MAVWHLRSKRKNTGGKYHSYRKKRRMDRGSSPIETTIGERKSIIRRVRGGNLKIRLKRDMYCNVVDKKEKKAYKVKIEGVVKNNANREFVRRNIITKGAIVKTKKGLAKITSRPGQHGILNAVLIDEDKNSG